MITGGVIAGLIGVGAYLAGVASSTQSLFIWAFAFVAFAYNMARAEIEELKLILDNESPGWRERNADWTSTWGWNRLIKRNRKR